MKQYHYFVSYQYKDSNDYGFGQTNLLLREPIVNPDQIEEVRQYLERRHTYTGVVLLNFILLKEEEIASS